MTNIYQTYQKLCCATLFFALLLTQNAQAQTRQKYRTFDGTLNNLSYTNWGAANIPLYRELPAEYADGKNALAGASRPTPRAISNKLSDEPEDVQNARDMSGLFYIWGQFLDHDITLSPTGSTESAPISLPSDESRFKSPIPFNRSLVHPGTGVSTPRDQTNISTSWIDASQVYGSDVQRANWLRTFYYGKLKVSSGNMLPFNTYSGEYDSPMDLNAPKMDDDNNRTKKTFVAGDPRAAEHPGLTSLHTLFVREHNRICDKLMSQGMTNDEEIYQKARKEIGAIMQAITYGQWLSALGVQLQSYTGYKSSVRPDIMNTFATAAYRWHTMVENDIIFRDNECHGVGPVELPLKDVFFNIGIVRKYDIGVLLKGLSVHQQYETDLKVNNGLRNFLFGPGSGLDLVSINLQRGRDHGLPNYNKVRQFYTGSSAYTFYDVTSDASIASKMQSLYGNVNNIDLWVGLFGEPRLPGKSVGKTLDAIIRAQFEKLRDGDYYFYMNDPEMAYDRSRISSTKLGDLIARNSSAGNFQDNVFMRKHCNNNGDDIANFACNVTPTFEGWTYLGQQGANTYYKWQGTTPLNYTDAILKAESLGGHLPMIKSAAQNSFIASKLGGVSTWINLNRSGLGWKYSDATTASYFNWASGEPNNAGGIESCAQMRADGKWNDIAATATQTLIVEVPYEDTAPPTMVSCPTNKTVSMGLLTLCKSATWTAPSASDNCSLLSVVQTSGPTNGSCLLPGVYNVGYTATDAKGNKSYCNFTVTAIKTLSLFSESQETLALTARTEPTRATIEWVSNTGFKNDYFTVEKANNTTGEFEILDIVNNTSSDDSPTHFVAHDNAPTEGDNTYRVTVTYQDGTKKVSEPKTVQFKGLLDVRVFPNPANDVVSLDLSNYKDQAVEIYLYNYLGQPKLVNKLEKVGNTMLELDVSNQPVGNYLIRVKSKGRRDVTKSVVIAH